MEYQFNYFKVLHFDGLDKVSDREDFKGYILLKPEPYHPFEDQLPIVFLWRYTIKKDSVDILRYSAQDKYLLKFNKENPLPIKEIGNLIDRSHALFSLEWQSRTIESSMSNRQLPIISTEDKIATSIEIINLAKSVQLI